VGTGCAVVRGACRAMLSEAGNDLVGAHCSLFSAQPQLIGVLLLRQFPLNFNLESDLMIDDGHIEHRSKNVTTKDKRDI
jgi:hypothetical protein